MIDGAAESDGHPAGATAAVAAAARTSDGAAEFCAFAGHTIAFFGRSLHRPQDTAEKSLRSLDGVDALGHFVHQVQQTRPRLRDS